MDNGHWTVLPHFGPNEIVWQMVSRISRRFWKSKEILLAKTPFKVLRSSEQFLTFRSIANLNFFCRTTCETIWGAICKSFLIVYKWPGCMDQQTRADTSLVII